MLQEEKIYGYIAKKPGNFGKVTYGPIFIPEGFDEPLNNILDKTYEETHNHRDKAMKILLEELRKRNIV